MSHLNNVFHRRSPPKTLLFLFAYLSFSAEQRTLLFLAHISSTRGAGRESKRETLQAHENYFWFYSFISYLKNGNKQEHLSEGFNAIANGRASLPQYRVYSHSISLCFGTTLFVFSAKLFAFSIITVSVTATEPFIETIFPFFALSKSPP